MAVIISVHQEICWQKLGKGKYTGIFNDGHQILSVRKSAGSNGGDLLVDLMIVTKSASQQICWQNGGNMMADLVTVTKSASQEICWLKWGRGNSAGRFSGSHQICPSGNMLAEIGEG